jgi:hypothetical protein
MVETISKMALERSLMFEKGDRYLHKEETIRDWMVADEARDELYESAEPPADVRCLKCRSIMNLLDKNLYTGGLNEPDRVLFMFDCPNGCLPRRAFYDNGEEWKPKPNPCPKCKKQMFFKKEDLRLFCKQGIFKCRSCQYKIDLIFKKE